MMRLFLTILSVFIFGLSNPASSQPIGGAGIAVVVNEGVISMGDINDRLKMIMITSGLPPTPEIQQKLLPQIISSLVEEEIKIQAGQPRGLDVSEEEIQQGFAIIASQNKLPPEVFLENIEKSGINVATMKHQIRSQLIWNKVVQAELRGDIEISEVDIDELIERRRANIGKTEYRLAEIMLPVETPDKNDEIKALATDMVAEIKSGKAPFQRIAQQFSKSAGAMNGGLIGWVAQDQVAAELGEVLPLLGKGEVSEPIRSRTGYHILQLIDTREITEDTLPNREQARTEIGMQRLERAQSRYLHDLKASAFIESRI